MDIDDDELMIIVGMVKSVGVLDLIYFLNLVCDNYLGEIQLPNQICGCVGGWRGRRLSTYEFFAQFPNWTKLCKKF